MADRLVSNVYTEHPVTRKRVFLARGSVVPEWAYARLNPARYEAEPDRFWSDAGRVAEWLWFTPADDIWSSFADLSVEDRKVAAALVANLEGQRGDETRAELLDRVRALADGRPFEDFAVEAKADDSAASASIAEPEPNPEPPVMPEPVEGQSEGLDLPSLAEPAAVGT